jgi:phage terminase large subunit
LDNHQTITIRIPEPEKVFNKVYRPFIENREETRKPLIVFEGGRGSGKSRAIAQHLIIRCLKSKTRVGLVRRVADTIRDSQWKELKDCVSEWGLSEHFRFLSSPLSIKVSNGSEFIAKGLDDPEKTKSLANVDVVWIEEATEIRTFEDYITLSLSVRGKGSTEKQKILSFNRRAGSWTEEVYFKPDQTWKDDPNIYHLHTTFKDNKFLTPSDIEAFESLKKIDPQLYEKNALGLPVRLKGLIYSNWDIVNSFPENCKDIIYGLDFGYNDPMTLSKLGRIENEIWIEEKFYEREKTTGDLIKLLPQLVHSKSAEIYADSAEPDRIEEIYRAGYNIKPAEKSVQDGIDTVKRFKLHIVAGGKETISDYENYKWKEDKNGKSLDEPNHDFSHAPDRDRYPIFTHWGKDFRNLKSDDVKGVQVAQSESSQMNTGVRMETSSIHQVNGY